MSAHVIKQTKQWLKQGQSPLARRVFHLLKSIRCFDLPAPRWIFSSVYIIHKTLTSILFALMRVFYWTPLFKSQTKSTGKDLYLYGGMPFISGDLALTLGNNCRISAQSTFSGRTASTTQATLTIGNNVDVGWMTTIACGTNIRIGNNVRIAGRAFLAGYPGHPINSEHRAQGLPDTEDQVGDIVLCDDVWLATGVTVVAGVTVGKGTIVAAGSVVTHDLPDNVLAGGVPAKVIKSLES